MRIDEWKKLLEDQFIDEEEEAQAVTALTTSSARTDTPPIPPGGLIAELSEVAEIPQHELANEPRIIQPTLELKINPENRDVVTEQLSPCTDPDDTVPQVPLSVQPYFESNGGFEILDLNEGLPSFNSHIDTVSAPFSVLVPLTSYSASPHVSYAPQSPDTEQLSAGRRGQNSNNASTHVRRKVRIKSCSVDQSRKLTVESKFLDGSLDDVPTHVRALLALGRTVNNSADFEVAQSSYKKQFHETRQELIERLLDPVLSLEEAARLLNVCPTTIRRYTNRGILKYYRKQQDKSVATNTAERETRQRRFRLSDIIAFAESNGGERSLSTLNEVALLGPDDSGELNADCQTELRSDVHAAS